MDMFLFSLIILFSCFFHGITGFGVALFAVPLSLLFLDKVTVMVALPFLSIFLNGFLIKRIDQPADMPKINLMLFSSLCGMPIGIYLLQITSTSHLQIVAGSISILFAALVFSKNIELSPNKITAVLIGWLAGLLQTSIAMSGPPVALLIASTYENKNMIRKNLVVFFMFMTGVSFLMYCLSDVPVLTGLIFGLVSLPFALLGAFLGDKVVQLISRDTFVNLAFMVICLTGIYTTYRGLVY
ncbi:protein of unknown function DUF81 [Nitrosomonas sp. Is79A3]|uniref:TSUP family transporter n=1 Tax=Nitrosomonas sp. (strain Is79A3) TaxID=261292 RepID=UPI000215D4A0